ncbi:2'-hydroxyisoflavone reductase [Scheffersomyces stipitis CBS 6054]|uniref:2'-hydroxyisoflavone reductase n=1 Tax=Scheffersomyces stipitis (strain ATCC 58785 / CBS 6054 / NBRC 10063 / NRRL Y-11545) TaxID=322104 RepID=A3LWE3_PICST|nr:2'-hydroxyisoflavone reductase [Scheffersomyces stipitis CBS 6054]ABN66956.2 2'-hydroxyisoflavone reductase [Scheffersomyces stipitis CBS 6054]
MPKVSVAFFGISGFLGNPIIQAFETGKFDDKIELPIKVVTRKELQSTDRIQYIVGNLEYGMVDSFASQLEGVDVIVELLAVDPALFTTVEKIVQKVKPKLFLPSEFGVDIDQVNSYIPGFLNVKKTHANNVREFGIKTVSVVTAEFAVPGSFLYEWVAQVGIDVKEKTITHFGDPNTKITICKLADIANSVLSLVTLDPQTIPDTVRIQSDEVTFQDVIDRYVQTHDVELKVVKTIPKEQVAKDILTRYESGFNKNDIFLYLQAIASQGIDKGLHFSEIHNQLVNPGESLWKWEKF